MTELAVRDGVPQYTLEHYERDFADRHLLHGVIQKWAGQRPDSPALIDFDSGREVTYREFDQQTSALALKLLQMGYRKEDFLATSLPLLIEHLLLEYACFKIGVIHAPLDLRLKPPEVIRSLELIRARGFAFLGKTPVADFTQLGLAVQAACPFVEHFIQFASPAEAMPGALPATTLMAEAAELAASQTMGPELAEAMAEVDENDGAQVIYTTGSTGWPKPALLSHRNITCQNMCLAGGFDMWDEPRMLVNLPPSHVGCQTEQLMTPLFAGGTCVLLSLFDAEKSLAAIEKYRCNSFGQIPAMFAMQWRLPNYDQYDLGSLRFALFAGQQVSRQFVEQVARMTPRIGTGLGLTEMAGFVTYTPLDASVDELVSGVGFDMPITPLSIRQPMKPDGTAGDELPEGETGEICFQGPQVFIGYVNDEDAYRRTVSSDGYCYTGDLGHVGPKGLNFQGRSKLVIKPKGYQVHPAQIENHFAALSESVAVCGAVGAPHDLFGEAVVLFIEPKPGRTPEMERLQSHAKEIAAYMRPTHYVLLEPGGLPLNRVAKTDYVVLQQQAMQEVQRLRSQGAWDQQ
jgi:acyl-CoA synthetase (AMP-forming)/AMP-acid ligase II